MMPQNDKKEEKFIQNLCYKSILFFFCQMNFLLPHLLHQTTLTKISNLPNIFETPENHIGGNVLKNRGQSQQRSPYICFRTGKSDVLTIHIPTFWADRWN